MSNKSFVDVLRFAEKISAPEISTGISFVLPLTSSVIIMENTFPLSIASYSLRKSWHSFFA